MIYYGLIGVSGRRIKPRCPRHCTGWIGRLTPTHPGWDAGPGVPAGGGDDLPDPGRRRARSGAAAGVAYLAEVPARPGIGHHGLWLPARRHRAAAPVVCPVRDGDPDPCTCASWAWQLIRVGPGRPSRPATCWWISVRGQSVQIPDPRPGQQVHHRRADQAFGCRRAGADIAATLPRITADLAQSPRTSSS